MHEDLLEIQRGGEGDGAAGAHSGKIPGKGFGGLLGIQPDRIAAQMAAAQLLHRVHGRQFPLANDADPVTGPFHLLEEVAGEKDGFALPFFLLDEFHEPVLHQRVQPAGGLVQHQQLGVLHEGGDNGQLLFGALAHPGDGSLGVQLEPLDQFPAAGGRACVPVPLQKVQKLLSAHLLKKGDLAGHIAHLSLDPVPLGPAVQTVDPAAAGPGPDEAHQMADQGGLSGAVGSEKAEDLAALDGQGETEHPSSSAIIPGKIFYTDFVHRNSSLQDGCFRQSRFELSITWRKGPDNCGSVRYTGPVFSFLTVRGTITSIIGPARRRSFMFSSTIAAVATAPGQGGIAVVRLSGPESYEVARQVFRPANPQKTLEGAKGYTALFGSFVQQGEDFDEGIALCFRAPHSYTGEDVIELSCHGGDAVARRLVEACIQAGAQPAGPGEYTRRALLNGKLSLTQAEAVMDLISAGGRQGAALAKAALDGALARKIDAQKEALTELQAHLAAWVDFPEEDVPALEENHLRQVLGQVEAELARLIDEHQAGRILREGVDCVILGRPNAGKSTLLNLLAGFDRAIVTDVAGTTRDVVEQAVQLGEIRLNLFDTAGLRQTEDKIEAEGIRRSWQKLEEAGLVIAVFDGSEPVTAEDRELARRCAGRPALALVNKEDKPARFDAGEVADCFELLLPVCCKEPEAREQIAAAVEKLLGTNRLDPHAASLSGQRQLAAAVRARDAVQGALEAVDTGFGLDAVSVCVDDALDALCTLTGENASEAVIDQVFERFCVGK